ncbi:1,4-alpha-glucan branching protein [Streptomyces sp. NBC_01754]|uniref:maltokinase N-terminal cap-like domain-containing protein n=1 Tax=Streptomyces sp. NBC_01754 TaxID=2975930 RepID=UPI002DD80F09|nr:1,4-alpha-glucan branching protein [Streptomyces sp. NBC_01754]WSC91735.1 1,4-alpha-glucan branching protein [Streptomyces sp. NBC_01754]
MAVIHRTTMEPGKLQLLSAWLPTRPWYTGTAGEPRLARAGGFRLDDPQGAVGMEFMVVTDISGDLPVSYFVPVTYRGAALDGADQALIGTTEHGVLGRRWVYDGVHDPVLVAQVLALLRGQAEPQAQSVSDTPDPTVAVRSAGDGHLAGITSATVRDTRQGTDVVLDGEIATLAVSRVLRPGSSGDTAKARGDVTGPWGLPDDGEVRGTFFALFD